MLSILNSPRSNRIDALSFRIQARPRFPPPPIYRDLGEFVEDKLQHQRAVEPLIRRLRRSSHVAPDPETVEIIRAQRMIKRRKIPVPEQSRRAPDTRDMGRAAAEFYPRNRKRADWADESNCGDSFFETIRMTSDMIDHLRFRRASRMNCRDSFFERVRSGPEDLDSKGLHG
jgi:hypothetical protein